MPAKPTKGKVRTTVRMPRPLYDEARRFVENAVTPMNNINDFFVTAIRAYIKLLQRKQIDAAFAGMADDAAYQKEAQLIAAEFSHSDWEAFEKAERDATEA